MLQLKWPVLALAGALALPSEELICTATEGATVVRTFRHEQEMVLEEMTMTMDGEENPMMGGMDMEEESSSSSTLRVRDAIGQVVGRRASTLERTYLELVGERSMFMIDPMGGEMSNEAELSSELEGQTVEFAGEPGEFTADWAQGSDGEDEALEGLAMSMELEELLPKAGVELGETWSIPVELLDLLRHPAGDVGMESDGSESLHGSGGEPDTPEENVEGTIKATYLELREEAGRRLAAVEIVVDVSTVKDLSDFIMMGDPDGGDLPEGAVMPEIDSVIEESLVTGEGLYLWDLEAGRLHSLELECEVVIGSEMVMLVPMGPHTGEMVQSSVKIGSESWEVTCEG